ncbi:hypothetical protein BDP55DRAFT_333374 [Colletotrichum godetiae]|uniref:Uncharacterized protein n=1 Tax=Colletotrichum godetiae TaxID=1209918 RepID=A0AAJ0END3_9PEZI|nr:uncharacterized protein BDP55DRAFT_333374 [Colletotrichum godetiae]KAK1659685.1 hypothetical protein BDP55DRAFT_333374 [Colletotrichum godetiae]
MVEKPQLFSPLLANGRSADLLLLFALSRSSFVFLYPFRKASETPIIHKVLSPPADYGPPSRHAEALSSQKDSPIPATQRASSPAWQVSSPRETLRACREVGWRAGEMGEARRKRPISPKLNATRHTATAAPKRNFPMAIASPLVLLPYDYRRIPGDRGRRSEYLSARQTSPAASCGDNCPFLYKEIAFSHADRGNKPGEASSSRGDSSPPGHSWPAVH